MILANIFAKTLNALNSKRKKKLSKNYITLENSGKNSRIKIGQKNQDNKNKYHRSSLIPIVKRNFPGIFSKKLVVFNSAVVQQGKTCSMPTFTRYMTRVMYKLL